METLRINLLNPKAARLLQDLADLDLIAIQKPLAGGFAGVLQRLRSAADTPSLEEITEEVELVRAKRYEQ